MQSKGRWTKTARTALAWTLLGGLCGPWASAAPHGDGDADAGTRLLVKAGCAACHRIADPAFADLPRRGPDMRRSASKLDPGWMVKWLSGPREFRPTTWMPHFFDVSDPRDVHNVVSYLLSNSQRVDYPEPPPGDPRRGEETFLTRGCTGCHLKDPEAKRGDHAAAPYRLQGPNLIYLGSKVSAGWLYAWLKDPRQYAPQTLMPNLRLGDQEAADLTAFLRESRNPRYEELSFSDPVPQDIARGGRIIERLGCFGCHLMPGFEDRRPDFGPLDGPIDWTDHELRSGFPVQGMAEEESAAIRARLAALEPPWEGAEAKALGMGRRLAATRNCRGCHLVEGEGRAVAATIEEPGLVPPDLHGEGSRVQEGWLRAFLADPSTVRLRSWLPQQMPTFAFSQAEIDTLIAYFAALEDTPHAEQPPGELDPRSLALGREAFTLMQCARCHPAGAAAAAELGMAPASLAPPLGPASERLRYGWLASWILDPQSRQPGTRMPSMFQREMDGDEIRYLSPYAAALDGPATAENRARILEHLQTEEALHEALGDAETLAGALRDWVWQLDGQ